MTKSGDIMSKNRSYHTELNLVHSKILSVAKRKLKEKKIASRLYRI